VGDVDADREGLDLPDPQAWTSKPTHIHVFARLPEVNLGVFVHEFVVKQLD
jgi:hypothetical protein